MKNKPVTRIAVLLLVVVLLGISTGLDSSGRQLLAAGRMLQSEGSIATNDQLEEAREEWSRSKHAATFDNGMGANTTCARCKSPLNWDPGQALAQQQAMDCGACKRIPGAPRPELSAGESISIGEWNNISCEICHQPAGDSYETSISFWNQALEEYESVDSVMELCGKCHEGRHGFQVIGEQEGSTAHQDWECTVCHGAHSSPSECTDCHNPTSGSGAVEHSRHPSVNCSGCHDDGRLTIWQDPEPASIHYDTFITRRFAHTLTSWPSHNLSTDIDCTRCHHPVEDRKVSIVPTVSCKACHEDGAVLFWCEYFPRDTNPHAPPGDTHGDQ